VPIFSIIIYLQLGQRKNVHWCWDSALALSSPSRPTPHITLVSVVQLLRTLGGQSTYVHCCNHNCHWNIWKTSV